VSDSKLRDAERRWQQTGAVEDEAALLQEQLRAGELSEARVQLAAWLGHAAAQQVTGMRVLAFELGDGAAVGKAQVELWNGLLRAGPESASRALIAHARHCVSVIRGELDALAPGSPTAAHAWLRAGTRCVDDAIVWRLTGTAESREALARDASEFLRTPQAPLPPAASELAIEACRDLVQNVLALDQAVHGPAACPWASTWVAERFRTIRRIVQAEVVPWALRRGDPLREQVERRLDHVEVASPCARVAWEDMHPVGAGDRVRRCDECALDVHDLSALTRDEAEALLRASDGRRLCVRLFRREDGRVLTSDCPLALSERLDQLAPRRGRVELGRMA
jgi:hypothetical protein